MSVMLTLILVVQMLSALAMIGLILIQHGKGADMGAILVQLFVEHVMK
jgi:preprotein translocase subunit SecG